MTKPGIWPLVLAVIFGASALAGYFWFWHAILNHPGSLSPGG